MTFEEQIAECQRRAKQIVLAHRATCPDGCDPKAWFASTTAIVTAVIAAAASATTAVMSAQAQQDSAKYNAAVARNQAETANQQAQFDAQQIRDKNRRLLGAQRAAYAASGVDTSSGSAQDVQSDSATRGELEALSAIYTGKTGATSAMARAKLDEYQGQSAMTLGYFSAGSSLLSGAAAANAADAQSDKPTFSWNK